MELYELYTTPFIVYDELLRKLTKGQSFRMVFMFLHRRSAQQSGIFTDMF